MIWALLREARRKKKEIHGYDPNREDASWGKKLDTDLCPTDDKVKNIINIYNAATEEERDFFHNWYNNAQQTCINLANEYSVDPQLVYAIVAVLSPGNRFNRNIVAAENLLRNELFGEQNPVSTNNRRNAEKAAQIFRTKSLEFVTGPKVSVFFKSLMTPKEFKERLVLDGHAVSMWIGEKLPVKKIKIPNREQILTDFQSAADCLGIAVQELQAVTWFVWKNVVPAKREEIQPHVLQKKERI
jgi:hypothetical protein